MSLNNICNVANMSISEKLEANLIGLFDWGFVDNGGYINIDVNQSGAYVDNRSILTRVTDPRATGTKFYQGPENWVYESAVTSSPIPFIPPLIYINGSLDLTPSINYRDGRVTPSVATTATSVVKAKFSYKWANFTSARKSGYRRQVQYRQNRTDYGNGENALPPEIRLPLPAVIIDTPPISKSKPYGIDTYGPRIYTHNNNITVLGESASDVVKICDYLAAQQGQVYQMYNPSLVVASGDHPLNFNGTINSGKNYDQLAADYPWTSLKILVAESLWGGYINENIYSANVRIVTELVACLNC